MPLPDIHDDQAYKELALEIITSPFYYDGEGPALPGQSEKRLMIEEEYLLRNYFDEVSKTESPDLQSEALDLGIEVTMAIDPDDAQDLDTFNKAKAQDTDTFSKNIAKIDKKKKFKPTIISDNLPEPIGYGIYVDQSNAHSQITRCIEEKNEKARNNYRRYADNWLFIFCPFTIDEDEMLKAIDAATDKEMFNMYVFSSWTKLGDLYYVYSPYTDIEKRHHYNIGEEV